MLIFMLLLLILVICWIRTLNSYDTIFVVISHIFVLQDNSCYLVAMASSGYIYTQVLSEESSAQHGPFYVTNVLQVHHQDLKVHFLKS